MKKVYYKSEKDLEGLKWCAKIMDFGVSLMIKAAVNELNTAYIMLRESPKFRHEIKNHAKQAMRAADRKESEILSIMASRQFYEDYSDKVIDLASNDITLFRTAMQEELRKAGIGSDDADLYAHVECARVLLNMCQLQFDEIIRQAQERWGRNYAMNFSEFTVTGIYRHWDIVSEMTYKDAGFADLNTAKIKALYDVMDKNFSTGKYIGDCLQEAKKNNPDFVNNFKIK